jgi:predicted Ser/Thr protein kinase
MTGDDNTQHLGEADKPKPPDPLGIIGWEIGGKYKIQKYIGGGGFGEVYEATNVNLVEQRLVVKFFKRVQARDRFDREAKILCVLDHPNISRVVDYLPDEGALVIQYIDGKDGSQLLRERGPLSAELYLRVARSVTDAIAYAHTKKIAHRDIKPGNIIVDHNGHVYVIDFGIAKEMGGVATQTGYQSLTPMFAAPERQTGGRDYNPFLSDIYEMGITLFNFATNSMPYRNPVAPSLGEWGGEIAKTLSSDLLEILRKATHPDPSQRYQTAADMAKALEKLTTVYATRSKLGWLYAAAAVVVVAVGGYFGWDYFVGQPGVSQSPSGGVEVTDSPVPRTATPAAPDTTPPAQAVAATASTTATPATPPAPERPAQLEPAPTPTLTIRVRPDGVSRLLVDDTARTVGRAFDIASGRHFVTVIHPAYPVLRQDIEVSSQPVSRTYDLRREFASVDTLSVQLAMNPYSDAHKLDITMNGKRRSYTQFPVFDLSSLAGDWQIVVDIAPLVEGRRTPRVDSCVTYPYGGGPRRVVVGGRGTLPLLPGESGGALPLLVFWSE